MSYAGDDARILVIACGNDLRGDDGLGPVVARQLVSDGLRGVMVIECHQLMPELIKPISDSELVIFIDASCEPGPPGEVCCHRVSGDASAAPSLLHHVEPAWLLACTHAAYRQRPEAIVYSVRGEHFRHGEGLSAAVAAALPGLLARLGACIATRGESEPALTAASSPQGAPHA